MPNLTAKQSKLLLRILASAAMLLLLHFLPLWPLYLIPYLLAGHDVLRKALRNIQNGQVFDENFLMTIATIGAFLTGEFSEAVFVMVFYQTGELFQDIAVNRSRASIAALMDICPQRATVEGEDGALTDLDPEEVAVGSVLVVRPGERVALDGVVLSGASSLDTAALTGESLPREVGEGDEVISGCVNGGGLLRVRVTKPFEDSTVAKILDLVENAGEKKARSERFVTRFARYYTPCVVAAALALFLIPTLLLFLAPDLGFLAGTTWTGWLHRALIFLVVSCPCALVISVPMSFFGGIGAASKAGILVKGSTYLEAMAKAETILFDKTGTLTQGVFTVTEVRPAPGFTGEEVLRMAAAAESGSAHPIARSLAAAAGPDAASPTRVEELPGRGLRAQVEGKEVLVGNRRLVAEAPVVHAPGTAVYVSIGGIYAGAILLADLPKAGAREAVAALKQKGVQRTLMLSGDREEAAAHMAALLGLDGYHAQLLPQEKVQKAEEILAAKTPGMSVVYVGDGVNDAPVLTRCDVGVAMGALGSGAAIEAADIVLMDDDPSKLPLAMSIARKTLSIVRQNIAFSLAVKGAVMVLGAMDMATMWMAVFADVGVAVIAILNAMRCLRVKK